MPGLLSGFAKDVIPGSLQFLLLGLVIGVLLLCAARTVRWGRRWMIGLIVLYLLLSLQGTSDLLMHGLWSGRPLRDRSAARGARAIVVLGNGAVRVQIGERGVYMMNAQTSYNAIEAARVFSLLGDAEILTSGGPSNNNIGSESEALAEALVAMKVPRERISLEAGSHTTRQQCEAVAAWLRAHGTTGFVLVTTPEHMRRANGVFEAMGLTPVPSPSEIIYGGTPFWRPTRYALQGSHNAIYEYIAVATYRLRGWI